MVAHGIRVEPIRGENHVLRRQHPPPVPAPIQKRSLGQTIKLLLLAWAKIIPLVLFTIGVIMLVLFLDSGNLIGKCQLMQVADVYVGKFDANGEPVEIVSRGGYCIIVTNLTYNAIDDFASNVTSKSTFSKTRTADCDTKWNYEPRICYYDVAAKSYVIGGRPHGGGGLILLMIIAIISIFVIITTCYVATASVLD
jgi:hypothetical protein